LGEFTSHRIRPTANHLRITSPQRLSSKNTKRNHSGFVFRNKYQLILISFATIRDISLVIIIRWGCPLRLRDDGDWALLPLFLLLLSGSPMAAACPVLRKSTGTLNLSRFASLLTVSLPRPTFGPSWRSRRPCATHQIAVNQPGALLPGRLRARPHCRTNLATHDRAGFGKSSSVNCPEISLPSRTACDSRLDACE
jgi:hypothetical protein